MGLARQARTGVMRLHGQAAGGFAAGVRGLGDERLRQVMITAPLRRALLEAIFRQMPRQLDRRRAEGVELAVRWVITRPDDGRADVYDLAVSAGRARVSRGEAGPTPNVTITVDGVEFLRLVSGNANPMRAYMSGDLAASGDIMAAARLASLFRVPAARSVRKQNANTVA